MRQRAAEAELQLTAAHAELQRLSAVADRCGRCTEWPWHLSVLSVGASVKMRARPVPLVRALACRANRHVAEVEPMYSSMPRGCRRARLCLCAVERFLRGRCCTLRTRIRRPRLLTAEPCAFVGAETQAVARRAL